MSKKVIVTGCSGQDGALMCEYLINNTEHEIFGVIRRSSKPDYSNIPEYILDNPRFQFIYGELGDSASMDNLVRDIQPDYFINLAANSFVGTSWEMPEQTFDVNTIAVIRQLEAIRKHKPTCRYYQAGSSEEFGDVIYSPQDEKHPLRPRSPYGASKASARHIVKVYRDSYNLYAIQAWLFNHESCERGKDFVTQKIVTNIARIKKELENKQIPTPLELGNLDAKRDWSHAKDFVRGIWMMLNQEEPKEYVLSSNETHSIREFIKLAFENIGYSNLSYRGNGVEEIIGISEGYEHFIPIVKINPKFYRPAEVELLLGDSSLARKELGWIPEYDFKGLVKEMVQCAIAKSTK